VTFPRVHSPVITAKHGGNAPLHATPMAVDWADVEVALRKCTPEHRANSLAYWITIANKPDSSVRDVADAKQVVEILERIARTS
jgi:hypothetical protein